MHSMPNLPKFSPGDEIRNRTLQHVAEITKSNSISSQNLGMHGYSTSTGTAYGLEASLQNTPFWAMVTGFRKQYASGNYPSLEDADCPQIAGQFEYCYPPYNPASCPNFWYAHSWVQLNEDYNLFRHGSEIFPVFVDPKLPVYNQPANQINGPLETYKRSCRDINGVYMSAGGMRGDIFEYPLYEVNNTPLPVGFITRIQQGKGRYMLAASTSHGMFNPFFYGGSFMFLAPEKSCCQEEALFVAIPPNTPDLNTIIQNYQNQSENLGNRLNEPGKRKYSIRDVGIVNPY